MNYIEQIRKDIRKDFSEKTFHRGDFETFLSPYEQFRLDATNFWSKEPNWDLTKVEIYDQYRNEKLFDFFVNDSQFFQGWLTKDNVNYLICAEDIFGGQTVVDLTNRKIVGYSPNEDGFIWTDFHLSPNGKTLATIGCYWACEYVIKLFDFSNPMNLPLKEIKEIDLLGNDEIILGWIDNETLQMKGIKREYEREYSENGSFRMKTISETKIERQIKVNE
jgi:hypothetical protein